MALPSAIRPRQASDQAAEDEGQTRLEGGFVIDDWSAWAVRSAVVIAVGLLFEDASDGEERLAASIAVWASDDEKSAGGWMKARPAHAPA